MSLIIFAVAVTLAGFGVAAPTEDYCDNFVLGERFFNKTLSGTIWKTFTTQHQQPEEFELDPFLGATTSWFYPLTPNEINAYKLVMEEDFPEVSWENVIYSWNFGSKVHLPNFKYGSTEMAFRFLIELKENPFGDIAAVPAGDTYKYMKMIGSKMTTPRYRIREVGENSLAIMFCERHHKYLLTKDMAAPKPQAIQLVFSSNST